MPSTASKNKHQIIDSQSMCDLLTDVLCCISLMVQFTRVHVSYDTIHQQPIDTLPPFTTPFRSRHVERDHVAVGPHALDCSERQETRPGADVEDGLGRRDLSRVEHRSEEHTSELQSPCNLVCRLLLQKINIRSSTPRACVTY